MGNNLTPPPPTQCVFFIFPCRAVTGALTGSFIKDNSLLHGGFAGEGRRGPSLSAVKYHYGFIMHPLESATIVLFRSPEAAIVAEWHRKETLRLYGREKSHEARAPPESFASTEFAQWVLQGSATWVRLHSQVCLEDDDEVHGQIHWPGASWRVAVPCVRLPLLLVNYDDLKTQLRTEMDRLEQFFRAVRPDTHGQARSSFEASAACVFQDTEGKHHRPAGKSAAELIGPRLMRLVRRITGPIHQKLLARLEQQRTLEPECHRRAAKNMAQHAQAQRAKKITE
eukprot:m.212234 g.212234  ORF g.212234 m.212234 type:complete len:283 (-) comp18585_c0_seq1:56-904(-)